MLTCSRKQARCLMGQETPLLLRATEAMYRRRRGSHMVRPKGSTGGPPCSTSRLLPPGWPGPCAARLLPLLVLCDARAGRAAVDAPSIQALERHRLLLYWNHLCRQVGLHGLHVCVRTKCGQGAFVSVQNCARRLKSGRWPCGKMRRCRCPDMLRSCCNIARGQDQAALFSTPHASTHTLHLSRQSAAGS